MRAVAAFAIVVMLLGCASKPPLLAEDLRDEIGSVSLLPARVADGGWHVDRNSLEGTSTAAGAGGGAASGALTANELFAGSSCDGWICGAVALVWLTAIATGAVVGAVRGAGAAHTTQREAAHLEDLRGSFDSVVASLDVAPALERALAAQLLEAASSAAPAGPAGTYEVTPGRGRAVRLDAQVRNVSFDGVRPDKGPSVYTLALFVRYRVLPIDADDPLYESYVYLRCGPWPFERWASSDAAVLKATLDNMYGQVAATVVDDVVRIYRSSDPDASSTEYHRGYFLDAVYPPRIGKGLPLPEHAIGFGFAGTRAIWNRQPLLRWTAVPHRTSSKHESLDVPASALRYDVRIFKDGVLVDAADGLTRPQYQPVAPLDTCSGYFWTFRARFTLADRLRVTDWSGAFNGWAEPWNGRYPLMPGLVKDRDEPDVMHDRTEWYHRFWVLGTCAQP
jgi:hypothetical protein